LAVRAVESLWPQISVSKVAVCHMSTGAIETDDAFEKAASFGAPDFERRGDPVELGVVVGAGDQLVKDAGVSTSRRPSPLYVREGTISRYLDSPPEQPAPRRRRRTFIATSSSSPTAMRGGF
jgi:hypothetical protein